MSRSVHPIEAESYRRLRDAVDLRGLPPLSRAVAERVIHASADVDYAADLVLDEDALAAGRARLAAGAPLITDVAMVAAGITRRRSHCAVGETPVAALAAAEGLTRSAAGLRHAARQLGPGAVYVVGCAPTALFELLDGDAEPSFVVGLPVGFVGAVEAKHALREAAVASISNRSAKGGSAVAAAAINALLYDLEER